MSAANAAHEGASAKSLLIVYHSQTGATERLAQAVARGAAAEGAVRVQLLRADAAGPEQVLASDGYVFASPEYLGGLAGLVKDFFDRCYYPALDRINGRPYAGLICAGSDGQGALRQLERIATGWRLRAVAPTRIVCTHAQTPAQITAPKWIDAAVVEECERLGVALAQGLRLGVF